MCIAAVALLVTGCGGHEASNHGNTASSPPPGFLKSKPKVQHPTAAHFVATVDNPWFPLQPGTVLTSIGAEGADAVKDVFRVTSDTKVVDGVTCTVVDDRVYTNGTLSERTADWYAQDDKGNVWYFGEATAELNRDGSVKSTEGSWEAGKHGAMAGLFMPARPRVGEAHWQEYQAGQAADQFRVKSIEGNQLMLTEEWSPLEPKVLDHKLYARGVGTVEEATVKGGTEHLALVPR
jgi:hypothetical protein